ncbi:MAG: sulfotransferase family protein [Sedimenticola sp.]
MHKQLFCNVQYGIVTDAGRSGHNGCRVGELILGTWMSQNLSRGSDTLVIFANDFLSISFHQNKVVFKIKFGAINGAVVYINSNNLKFTLKGMTFYLPYALRSSIYRILNNKRSSEGIRRKFRDGYHRYGGIFFHIPKNAGTSINLTLYGSKDTYHTGIFDVMEMFSAKEFRKGFKFAFVRHPLDRLVSSYHHLKKGGWKTGHDVDFFKSHGDVTSQGFSEFVRWLSRENNCYEHVVLIPQHEFICLGNHIMVDYLGRFESLEKDFSYISNQLSISQELPKSNVTKHRRYSEYYDDDLIENCKNIYRRDFEIFGYDI